MHPATTARAEKLRRDIVGSIVFVSEPVAAPSRAACARPKLTSRAEALQFESRIAQPGARYSKVCRDILGCGTVLVQTTEVAEPPARPALPTYSYPVDSASTRPATASGSRHSSSRPSFSATGDSLGFGARDGPNARFDAHPSARVDLAERYTRGVRIADARSLRADGLSSHFELGGPYSGRPVDASRRPSVADAAAGGKGASPRAHHASAMRTDRGFRHLRSQISINEMGEAGAGHGLGIEVSRPHTASAPTPSALSEAHAAKRGAAAGLKSDLLSSHFVITDPERRC